MRTSIPTFAALVALTFVHAAHAEDFSFIKASGYEVAQRGEPPAVKADPDPYDQDERDREQERRDRAEARRDRAEARRERAEARRERPVPMPRFWVGIGAGIGAGSVKVPCGSSSNNDCTNGGTLATYSANVTITGPYTALRLRGLREQGRDGNRYVPYEEAAMVGSRFGRSDWYGVVGVGRVVHPDDKHPDDTHGFAWEILFAPSSLSAMGLELGFQGQLGEDVDYAAFNLGLRFGQLR